ncbi:hypothetical protein PMAYCL1PPCAC_11786 [Pristionchus mayeri]|uniref:KAT8 regulatory NSL complex subunit 2 n=1 Tax=Pristionchus mayeri TaxID=1317129 RepID=A0AAN4ZM97_9BILA|nr:hypothetical protein PMAYCL1PPCAC_11786 [Pristionchus mayeri]
MSTSSTAEGPSMEDHEDIDAEDHLDSSSSHVHDSSKEGEVDDQSSTKPKRNRKSTQRLLDSFMDDELSFAHKHKKKTKPVKKESSTDAHNESGGDLHSEAASEHEPAPEEAEKERRTRVVPGKSHVQCTFMESKKKSNSQCKQRAIEGYLFCIWHILNDKQAPYKRCANMRTKQKNGLETEVQCKTAIKDTQEPPYCLAHSDKAKKPMKKKKEAGPSPSTSAMKDSSPLVASGSVAPSSPSSSIFNLPNDEFAHDIDEAIGNMNEPGNLMDFDEFESLDNEDDIKEESKEGEEMGVVSAGGRLPFEMEEDLDEEDIQALEELVGPIYIVGEKIVDRLKKMRQNCHSDDEFWAASKLHPDAPSTTEEYSNLFANELKRLERMNISPAHKQEISAQLRDPHSELAQELALIHKFNTDRLREQHTMQRSNLNNLPG